ncbi:MAG: hypothetical protein DMG61_10930 [Acidobacteria bacterium]|nr:MAG: hypothetical protein DMG61_10930 [Acidobacteriota bacterium]
MFQFQKIIMTMQSNPLRGNEAWRQIRTGYVLSDTEVVGPLMPRGSPEHEINRRTAAVDCMFAGDC